VSHNVSLVWRGQLLGAFASLGLLGALACASPSRPPAAPPAEANAQLQESDSDSDGEKSKAWSAMSRPERQAYMATVVMPKMEDIFARFEPAEYAGLGSDGEPRFRCETCHGATMRQVGFAMPNTLHPLPSSNPMATASEYDAKVAAFMAQEVVPAMAALLGTNAASAENPSGFGCFGCHARE
jgi:hypothetical protein